MWSLPGRDGAGGWGGVGAPAQRPALFGHLLGGVGEGARRTQRRRAGSLRHGVQDAADLGAACVADLVRGRTGSGHGFLMPYAFMPYARVPRNAHEEGPPAVT